jgi:O-antigen/teichoic acid export membrane protein
MSISKHTARSITSNWLLLAVNVAISFFMSPFIVDKLGSTYYGIWAVATQFTGYLYLLDFGVRESVIRYTSKYVARRQSNQLNQVLNTAMLVYLPIALACVALTALAAWAAPIWFEVPPTHITEARLAIFFVGLTIAQTFVFNVFTGILQGLNRFDVNNSVGLVITFVRAALIVGALSAGYKLVALALIQFAMAILGGTVCAIIATRLLRSSGIGFTFRLPRWRRVVALSKKLFGYGFYVLINNIAQKINFASDAVVIALFLPVASVTPFAIAGSLIEYLRSLMISTAQVFSPLSSTLYTQRRHEDLALLLVRGAKLTVLVTLPISLTFAVLGEHFIGLWMGPQYMESAGAVLLVLALTQIISAPHYIVSSVLYGMSKHRMMAWLRVGEAAANLGLSIYLVQKMGIVGVALGTAISHAIVVLLLLPTLVSRLMTISISQYFIRSYCRPLLAAVPFLVAALWVRNHWPAANLAVFFAQVAALCCVYVAAVYALALDPEERQMILKLVARKPANVPG